MTWVVSRGRHTRVPSWRGCSAAAGPLTCLSSSPHSALPLSACSKYLRRPVVVTIGTAGKATDNVTQRVVVRVQALAYCRRWRIAYLDCCVWGGTARLGCVCH